MNELIRRSLVDRIENIIADFEARQLSETDINDVNYDDLKCISECLQYGQSIINNSWVSVEDRLPKDYTSVLAFCEGTERNGTTMCTAQGRNEFWYIPTEVGRLSFPKMQYKVTYWMPLPQPPQRMG